MENILITGVSTGIGYDSTCFFIKKGYRVIGSVRKPEDAKKLENKLGSNFIPLIFDVRDIEKMESEIDRVSNILNENGLKGLINNAGIAVPGPLQCISEEDFEKQLDINVKSVRRITNKLLPFLGTDSKYKPGRIINISSISGLMVNPFTGAYSISKFALEAMNDAYRRELDMFGIKVVAVEPGPIKTEIWDKNKGALEPYLDTAYGEILKNADHMIDQAEKNALPTEAVNKVLLKAIENRSPKTRYIVHKHSFLFKLLAKYTPDKWVDQVVRMTLKGGNKHRMV
jgi:short-subunit dehydrogenase